MEFRNKKLEQHLDLFRKLIDKLRKGTGAVVGVSGNPGVGKTHLLNMVFSIAGKYQDEIASAIAGSQSPIGNFNIGNIQPMYPFTKAIESLAISQKGSAQKRFSKNLFLTGLSLIPLAGDVFWAIKETGRDWREYKKDKSSDAEKKVSTATADYYDTLRSLADKTPLVVLIDDMHWCDTQSLELLNMLSDKISDFPLLLVFTFTPDDMISSASPLMNYVKNRLGKSDNVFAVKLPKLDLSDLTEISADNIKNYKKGTSFDKWFLDHTFGISGVVSEYLTYFRKSPPFDESGKLHSDFGQEDFVPTSVQSTFSGVLGRISPENRNILAICSAEGSEFTAMVVSDLLNKDVLTTIQILRKIQDSTGLIKSVGAKMKYGMKTTTYRFTQAYYHQYFEKSLEYEEYIALHGQIAALLKKHYDSAEDDFIREEIAPYLAAHSAESGDDDTARTMLLKTAEAAQKYGSAEIIRNAYDNFIKVGNIDGHQETETTDEIDTESIAFREMVLSAEKSSETEESVIEEFENFSNENGAAAADQEKIADTDFRTVRKAIIKRFIDGDYTGAASLAENYLEGHNEELDDRQKVQILLLQARPHMEMDELDKAEDICYRAQSLQNENPDKINSCLLLNSYALLKAYQGRINDATYYLQEAANKAVTLSSELRLLTLTNIAMVLKDVSPGNAKKYMDAAKELSSTLNYSSFKEDFLMN